MEIESAVSCVDFLTNPGHGFLVFEKLMKFSFFQVVLVDQSERFVFKPMLYELLSGEVDVWEIAPRFSDLLTNTGIRYRVKTLLPCDHLEVNGSQSFITGGTVLLESGFKIEYDWLVLALGAESKLDVFAGGMESVFPFYTLEDAIVRVRSASDFWFMK